MESPSINEKKKRQPSWTEKEKIVLMELVVRHERTLFGKLKGTGHVSDGSDGLSQYAKQSTWGIVLSAVNAVSVVPRTLEQVKKQVSNIRQRSNEKLDLSKKTGGGPKPASPTVPEKLWLDATSKRPGVQGILTGLDSESDTTTCTTVTVDSELKENTQVIQSTGPAGDAGWSGSTKDTPVTDMGVFSALPSESENSKERRSKKRKLDELEMENLELENKRLRKELLKMDIECEKMRKEVEVLDLKKIYLSFKINKQSNSPRNVNILNNLISDM